MRIIVIIAALVFPNMSVFSQEAKEEKKEAPKLKMFRAEENYNYLKDKENSPYEKDYLDAGVENQFVLESDGKIVGVTGYREVSGTDQTAWLTWTYLDEACQGKGYGKSMVSDLLDKLRSLNARKIFTKVS